MSTTIFLVDDHPIFIEGLKSIFEPLEEFYIKAIAENGEVAINKMREMQDDPPQIILMDLSMPRMDGIEATKIIKEEFPESRVIILTANKERAKIKNSLNAKVDGYMLKESIGAEIRLAVEEIKNGNKYFSPPIQKVLVDIATRGEETSKYDLTKREFQILERVVGGKTSLYIGEELFISENTVNTHRRNIHKKLSVNNVVELIEKVNKEGLLNSMEGYNNMVNPKLDSLTPKETEVYNLVEEKKTSHEIASLMEISIHTVNNHRKSIKKKLNDAYSKKQ